MIRRGLSATLTSSSAIHVVVPRMGPVRCSNAATGGVTALVADAWSIPCVFIADATHAVGSRTIRELRDEHYTPLALR